MCKFHPNYDARYAPTYECDICELNHDQLIEYFQQIAAKIANTPDKDLVTYNV